MTDEQIIKALEYCTNNYGHCENCPYRENEKGIYCVRYLPQNALDLINQQQVEIERLKKENDEMFDSYTQAVFLQTKRTTEAIKKLVDVLKTKKLYSVERHEYIVPVAVIDWTEKEMVGEGK
jgi:hypothetical protein